MSQPDSIEPRVSGFAPKARPDIYTVMLGISLFAILVAIVCLLLEMSQYQWDFKAAGARAAAPIQRTLAPALAQQTTLTHAPLV